MIAVGINGYGTIGKRVADAVRRQPDMEVTGVAKTRPDIGAATAVERGLALYAAGEETDRFDAAGVPVAGSVDDLVAASDVVVDTTPADTGAENRQRYETHRTPAVFQGGESPDIAEASFVSRANFADVRGVDSLRVVSCNTTGLARAIIPLQDAYDVKRVHATLVRRGGDPGQTDRGPINDIVPDPPSIPSHHAVDVNTVLPDLAINTVGLTVPTTLMHLQSVAVTLDRPPSDAEIKEVFATEPRIAVVSGADGVVGCGSLRDLARDIDRPRGDLWENCLWAESVVARGNDVYFLQAIHQESNVVPENVDAIRAVQGDTTAERSREVTDATLGVGITVGHEAPDAVHESPPNSERTH